MENVYANAVLKDGKLIFWWSGYECHSVDDFYEDFFCSGLNMKEELKNHDYQLKKRKISRIGSKEEKEFYKQFLLHEEFKGQKPY